MRGIFRMNLLPFQPDAAAVGVINAGQRFNQRGFTRAVFAEQRHNFAAPQAEVDVIQRFHAGKILAEPLGAEDFRVGFSGHGALPLTLALSPRGRGGVLCLIDSPAPNSSLFLTGRGLG